MKLKIIEALEREGGHVIVLTGILLLCIGLSLWINNDLIGKTGDLTLGALLLSMKGAAGKAKPEPAPEPVKSETENVKRET